MSEEFFKNDGFKDFNELIEKYSQKVDKDKVLNAIQKGADALAKDVRALPKPRSSINKSGYTHLLDTVTKKVNTKKKEIEVGWGKYYGPMIERGTKKIDAQPHIKTTYNQNIEKYQKIILQELGF